MSLLLIFTAGIGLAQVKQPIKVSVEVDPVYEKITVTLTASSDSLNDCMVQIIDEENNVLKTVRLPKSANYIESTIIISELLPGNYTCRVFKQEEEIYNGKFAKDAILIEPQGQPAIHNSPN